MYGLHKDPMKIPVQELVFILPEPRQRLFLDMLDEYQKRYDMKLIYATLNFNAENQIEYLIIFKAKIEGNPVIIYDAPYIYTTRAIPGYRYCKREGNLDEWFTEAMTFACRLPQDRFNEFIQASELSLYKHNPNYWKKPENVGTLIERCRDMMLQYKADKK